jgi:hypothetical protein
VYRKPKFERINDQVRQGWNRSRRFQSTEPVNGPGTFVHLSGCDLLHNPDLNKATAFTDVECCAVYVFPAMGMSAFATEATLFADETSIVAVEAVAEEHLAVGLIYEHFSQEILHRIVVVGGGAAGLKLVTKTAHLRYRQR